MVGSFGRILFILCDCFGNFVYLLKSIFEFEVRVLGFGGVIVERNMLDDGKIEFFLNMIVIGIYKVVVLCLDMKEDLSGCFFEVCMGIDVFF